MAFLITKEVKKQYASHLALNGVSISVPEGKIFGLLGPNGAGKTTLIRIINRITAPDSGEVFFNNELLSEKHIAQIGYLPEERGLYKKMEVGEQAMYLARLKGLSKNDAKKKLKFWFEKFEIMNWWNKKVEELSKGMQQKIQFIVTILHEPKLLIFDEPFSGFDPINANLLKQEILSLKENGATILFSTHNMSSVEELCDNIALINKSQKILDGAVSDIREQYKSNIFEIVFLGHFDKFSATLTATYEILEVKTIKNKTSLRIKLLESISSNELLTNLISFGTIISFNEVLPTINDIFIRAVGENSQQKSDLS